MDPAEPPPHDHAVTAVKTFEHEPFHWEVTLIHPKALAAMDGGGCDGAFYGVEIKFDVHFPQDYPFKPYDVVWHPEWASRATKGLESDVWDPDGEAVAKLRWHQLQIHQLSFRSTIEAEEADEFSQVFDSYHQQVIDGFKTSYQVFLKTLTGKTIQLQLSPSDAIKAVKEQIRVKEGVPVESQLIVFAGKGLDNDKTVARYGVQEGSTLHLVLNQDGCTGCLANVPGKAWSPAFTVQRGLQKTVDLLWKEEKAAKNWTRSQSHCDCNQRELETFFRGRMAMVVHWILRCNSPSSNVVWSPETDKMWPFLFRLNIRYLTKIKVAQGSGEAIALPLDIVKLIAVHL